jgi:hypothetical protein
MASMTWPVANRMTQVVVAASTTFSRPTKHPSALCNLMNLRSVPSARPDVRFSRSTCGQYPHSGHPAGFLRRLTHWQPGKTRRARPPAFQAVRPSCGLPLYVRFALIATELMRRNELSRSANSRHYRVDRNYDQLFSPSGALPGSRTVNTEPLPDSLVTVTSPPIMRASLRESARPSPVPP